ncbi:uncharacterized protein LOC109593913 [Aethina tumida]|uniref:uncharacterized protein LOC109593913 n=1 Tax=Aethina tumida TaxID=116153 RepID=UPI00096B4871|nr:uncharacterized protein LOC109593913 [Aethina tumida]
MKVLILSLFFVQAYCSCYFGSTNPKIPNPQFAGCDGSAPDKDETLLKLNGGKPIDYILNFKLKNYSNDLYPEMMTILPGIRSFGMTKNSFKTIPKDFFTPCSKNLQYLTIIDNKLESIDVDALLNLKNLKNLFLLKNENLKDFDIETLKNCNKLEILAVPAYTFNKLEVAKLKSYFPSLRSVGVYEGEEDLVKDKANELKPLYHVFYESTVGL